MRSNKLEGKIDIVVRREFGFLIVDKDMNLYKEMNLLEVVYWYEELNTLHVE